MASRVLMTKNQMSSIIDKLASEILSNHQDEQNLVLVGIKRRGADIATRICNLLEKALGRKVPLGELDINLYRDDWTKLSGRPHIGISHIPVNLDNKIVILIDDVLFSGRTVRAALEALFDYGRPEKVELLTFVDRGHRELPIYAKYIGSCIETRKEAHVDVLLEERDGIEAVMIE